MESSKLRQELQSYFDTVYPYSKVDTEHTLGGQIEIRFELGGDEFENATIERVNQATDRALTLFYDTFENLDKDIWVLIYEYEGENIFNASNEYLHKQFPTDSFARFYNKLEQVNTRYIITDKNGNDILEQQEQRVIVGKLPVKDIDIKGILIGITNTEMGFEPSISQCIYFFDFLTDKAFHIYDDRGCFVWSNSADKIRSIYMRRNDWIVDYHRLEIDEYFKIEK